MTFTMTKTLYNVQFRPRTLYTLFKPRIARMARINRYHTDYLGLTQNLASRCALAKRLSQVFTFSHAENAKPLGRWLNNQR